MNWKIKLVVLLSMVLIVFEIMDCERDGDAEKAGKKIDNAISELQK